jgi:hypothetical protein
VSLREELQTVIRLEVGKSELGDVAVLGTGKKAWGSAQDVIDLLVAYCTGLETAVLRLADEVEGLQFRRGEPEP